jgi:hypothetical protein
MTLKNCHPDRTIEIVEVRPSCGCTKVNLQSAMLAPGQRTTLTGTLKEIRKPGRFRHSVTIRVAGADRDEVRGEIFGIVTAHLRLSAPDFRLSYSAPNGTLEITNDTPQRVEFGRPTVYVGGSAESDLFKASLSKGAVEPGEGTTLRVSMERTPKRQVIAEILLSTSYGPERLLTIPASFQPPGNIKVVPARVDLGVIDAKAPAEREIRVRLQADNLTQYRVNVVSQPPFVKKARTERVTEHVLDLIASLEVPRDKVRFSGTIALRFESGATGNSGAESQGVEGTEVEIPVSGICE